MKCDELQSYKGDVTIPVYGTIADAKVYLKSEADRYIAELKGAIERNKIADGSVRRILWNLMDCGIIKEWYYNGEYNVLLSADDPHIQIAELKTKIDKVSLKFCKQLRHQKYKRCLAMAWWCSAELGMLVSTWEFKIKHYKKWQNRWLALAEKFKVAK